MARVTINRDYLLTINGNGKLRYIPDEKLRGFCIKVSPTGSVAFYYRWDKPRTAEGKRQQGSKFIANWPGTEPGKARDMAAKFAATVEHSTDDNRTILAKRDQRANDAERVRVVPTLGEYLTDTYGPHVMVTRNTGARIIDDIRKTFAAWLDKPINLIETQTIDDWKTAELARVMKSGKPVKPATMNSKLNKVKGLFKHAARRLKIENPAKNVLKVDEGADRIRWLRHDEAGRLTAALDARESRMRATRLRLAADSGNGIMTGQPHTFAGYVKPAVLTAINTGARRKELLTLRWADIDLYDRAITVTNSKTKRSRVIPINDELYTVLLAWREQSFIQNLLPVYVFGDALDRPRREVRVFRELLREASIKGFRFHDIRHTFATWALAGAAPLDVVSK